MMNEEEVREYLARLEKMRDEGLAINEKAGRSGADGGLSWLSVVRMRVLLRVLGAIDTDA